MLSMELRQDASRASAKHRIIEWLTAHARFLFREMVEILVAIKTTMISSLETGPMPGAVTKTGFPKV